ncbi:MAG: hypothetical protein ACE5KC_03165 [Candidatus Bathyarchaeia archaeon]
MNKVKLTIPLFIVALSITSFAYAYPNKTSYCDGCHTLDPDNVWISITVLSQTESDITYSVSGSNYYNGLKGWAVFDPAGNNIANGYGPGTFTLPKDGQTYRVYWVDDSDPGKGGSAYEEVITPVPPPPPPAYGADLVKKSAWPEHHHFDRSAEQGRGEDLNNTLFGLVRNTGADDVYVKVFFTIYKDGSSIGEIETEPYLLTIAEYEYVLTKDFDVTVWGDGKFKIEAQAWYQDPADDQWKLSLDSGIKSFRFAVVP